MRGCHGALGAVALAAGALTGAGGLSGSLSGAGSAQHR